VAPILIAHVIKSNNKGDWIDKNIIALLFVLPSAFFLTTPYAILDYDTFLNALKYESRHYSTGHSGHEAKGSTSFYLYARYLLFEGYGLLPTVFSGFGLIWLLRKDPWKAIILVSAPLLIFLFVGRYKVFFPRNIVAVVPFLYLFIGFFVVSIYEWLIAGKFNLKKSKRMLLGANGLLIIVLVESVYMQAVKTLKHVNHITLPDTRWVSIEWLKKNIPEGSGIGREFYTPPLEKHTNRFKVVYLGFGAVAKKPEDVQKLDYMIVSSFDYLWFLDGRINDLKQKKAYMEFFDTHELVKTFCPDSKFLSGPTLSIYKIKKF
jgi:hypothetical protein